MEINNFIGTLTLILALWVFVMQLKLNELSYTLKKLTKNNSISTPASTEQTAENDNLKNTEEPKTAQRIQRATKCENKKEKADGNDNFEKLFLGNLFNKIGAIAIIIAVTTPSTAPIGR